MYTLRLWCAQTGRGGIRDILVQPLAIFRNPNISSLPFKIPTVSFRFFPYPTTMKLATTSALLALVPAFVAAHADNVNVRHVHHNPLDARQAAPSPATLAAAATTSANGAATPATGTATAAAGTTTGAAGATTGTPSLPTTAQFSLLATNPTAVPLSAIVSNQPSSATLPLDSTAVPGATPTNIPGAPALPNGMPIFFWQYSSFILNYVAMKLCLSLRFN
jgi:hypothetical protein